MQSKFAGLFVEEAAWSFKWAGNQRNKLTETENGALTLKSRKMKSIFIDECILLDFIYNNRSFSAFLLSLLQLDVFLCCRCYMHITHFLTNENRHSLCALQFCSCMFANPKKKKSSDFLRLWFSITIIWIAFFFFVRTYFWQSSKMLRKQNDKNLKWKYLNCTWEEHEQTRKHVMLF